MEADSLRQLRIALQLFGAIGTAHEDESFVWAGGMQDGEMSGADADADADASSGEEDGELSGAATDSGDADADAAAAAAAADASSMEEDGELLEPAADAAERSALWQASLLARIRFAEAAAAETDGSSSSSSSSNLVVLGEAAVEEIVKELVRPLPELQRQAAIGVLLPSAGPSSGMHQVQDAGYEVATRQARRSNNEFGVAGVNQLPWGAHGVLLMLCCSEPLHELIMLRLGKAARNAAAAAPNAPVWKQQQPDWVCQPQLDAAEVWAAVGQVRATFQLLVWGSRGGSSGVPSGQALAAAQVTASMLMDTLAADAERRSPGSGRRHRLALAVYGKEGDVLLRGW
jgi:hypothetical protein